MSRGRTRRKRPAPLRVRRLERRRVLDAAVTELVLSPTDLDGATEVHDTHEGTQVSASATATGFGDLFYEWTLRKDGQIVEKGYETTYDFTPLDDGNYSITLKVTDSAQSSASQTQEILVHNLQPVLTVPSEQTIDEGSLLELSALGGTPLGMFTDAGLLDTHTASVDWGDGSAAEAAVIVAASGTGKLGGSHTYSDSGVYTVTVLVTDDDGGSDTQTFTVTVNNVAPTATLNNDGPVNEGSSANVSFTGQFDPSSADIAAGFRYAYDFDNDGAFEVGDGTYAGSVTSDSQMVSAAQLADGPSVRTVRARIIDQDGGFTDYTTDITVNNVAPALTNIVVEDSTLDEGQTAQITMNIEDPGALDVFSVVVNWQEGNSPDTITDLGLTNAIGVVGSTSYSWDAQSRELTVRHLYLDDNPTATSSDTYAVALTVRDDDLGSSNHYTVDVTVANVAPVLTTVGDQAVDEGAILDLSLNGGTPLGQFTDEGILDAFQATVDWGDGTPLDGPVIMAVNGSGMLGATHVYENDGVYTVTVTVVDDDGGADVRQFQVTVGNVAPTAVLANDGPVDEGSSATVSFTGQFDPSVADTLAGFRYAYDFNNDGIFEVGDGTYGGSVAGSSQIVSAAFLADGPGTRTVRARIIDQDGGFTDYTTTITIYNVAPELINIVVEDATIDEGQTATITATIDDPGSDTFEVDVDWKDGGAVDTLNLGLAFSSGTVGSTTYVWDAQARLLTISHLYLDDNPTGSASDLYTVMLAVRDDDGGAGGPYNVGITVSNVAPALTVVQNQTVAEGTLLDLTGLGGQPSIGEFSDPGILDSFQATIDWGDGTPLDGPTIMTVNGEGKLGASHAYADDGVYTVTVTVTDDDGGTDTKTFRVTVQNVAPTLEDIVVADDSIDEGQHAEIQATISDPGAVDTFSVDVDWKDGLPADTITGLGTADTFGVVGSTSYTWDADTRELTVRHLYLDDNPTNTGSDLYAVELVVRDDDLAQSGPYTVNITVSNVAPALEVVQDQTVNEGSVLNLSGINGPFVGSFVDAGILDSHQATIDWGDGTPLDGPTIVTINGNGTLAASHIYADDGVYTVTVTVKDDDGGIDTDTFRVTVNNVDPTLSVTPSAASVNEGSAVSFEAMFSDPGFDNPFNPGGATQESFTYDIDWGDGRDAVSGQSITDANGSPGTPSTGAFSGNHVYADDGVYTVTVTIHDDNGGSDVFTFQVTVNNVDPTLTVTPSANTVNEGSTVSFEVMFNDPGFDNPFNPGGATQESFTYDIDWGDGRDAVSGQSVADTNGSPGVPSTGEFNGSHVYADDGVYTVTVTIHDDNGGSHVQSFEVTVQNVAPIVAVPNGDQVVNEGALLSLTDLATFTDPGFDNPLNPGGATQETFTYDINWGDGRDAISGASVADTNGAPGVPSSGTIAGSHTYADDGVYTVTITVYDDNGGSHKQMFQVTVNNVDPTLAVTPSVTAISEGQTVDFSAMFSDPGFDNQFNPSGATQESFTYDIDWGDGRNLVSGQAVLDDNGSPGFDSTGSFSGSHIYADDGTYTVTVTIKDDDGGSHSQAFVVVVTNVAPAVTDAENLVVNEGQLITLGQLDVKLTDPGFDNPNNPTTPPNGNPFKEEFAAHSINWGDGTDPDMLFIDVVTPDELTGPTTATFEHLNELLNRMDHVYADNGTYTVTIRVADDNMGAFADASLFTNGQNGVDYVDLTFEITVENVVPVVKLPNGNLPIGVDTIFEAEPIFLTDLAEITDPGFDGANGSQELFQYWVDWNDDGTFDTSNTGDVTIDDIGGYEDLTDGSFNQGHIYADNGTYTVRVRIADDDMGAYDNLESFVNGVAGVDYVEMTFTIVVTNAGPSFTPQPDGSNLQGDDLNTDGQTIIRVAYSDPGYDNPNNTFAANGAEREETFNHLVNWGDGTIDAIHQYTSGGTATVTVTMTIGGNTQSFTFNDFNKNNPVLTLVSSQPINDPAVVPQLATYVVDWGDGHVETFQLSLRNPGLPVKSNGLTTILASTRVSGNAATNTTGSAAIQHTYLGPPNPLNPTADITIAIAVFDDDGAAIFSQVQVSNPGIETVNVAIDTTPAVPRLDLTLRPMTDVFVIDANGVTQLLQIPDVRGGSGDVAATTERYLELRIVYPDGSESEGFKIKDEALSDLRAFFATLPDGKYRIYLVRTENNSERLVIEVDVRRGRVVDVSDDSEGTRDRPPTEEGATEAVPLDENPLLEKAPAEEKDSAANGDLEEARIIVVRPKEDSREENRDDRVSMYPALGLSLSVAALVAAEPWSRRVDTALAQADDTAWQRLRRAGRWGRAARGIKLPNFTPGACSRRKQLQ